MLDPDYFTRKRSELGFDRVDQLSEVQAWCDERFPGQIRVKRLHQGTLRIVTPSAGVAGELRLRQVELMRACQLEDVRLAISIATLD